MCTVGVAVPKDHMICVSDCSQRLRLRFMGCNLPVNAGPEFRIARHCKTNNIELANIPDNAADTLQGQTTTDHSTYSRM